jgi:hypothetical protein
VGELAPTGNIKLMSAVSQAFTAADPLNGAGPRYGG